jgi:TonB-linked SusC/RagA family outer membrane protein
MFFMMLITPTINANDFASERISLNMRNAYLKDVLREIKSQTQFDFIYNSKEIQNIRFDNLQVDAENITDVMDKCLNETLYQFEIRDNIVIIRKRKVENNVQETETVTGIVVNEDGEPLPGVNIIVVGGRGFISDSEGKFNIIVNSLETDVVQFSYIGTKPQSIELKGQVYLRVVMQEESQDIDEVVVTGYEVVNEKLNTGVAETVKGKELLGQGIDNIDVILEGKIVGVNSQVSTGAVGVRNQITIRGENSLNGNTEPLWILDGLPMTGGVPTRANTGGNYANTIMEDGLGNIMPEDIASITVLKDAAAAAIYGAQASNGVIVIETKKGFKSATRFTYSGNYAYNFQTPFDAGLMNASEKLEYETALVNDFGLNYSGQAGRGGMLLQRLNSGYITREEYDAEYARLAAVNTNWFDEIFQPSQSMSHNINVRGGTDAISYYNSLSYVSQNGTVEQNKSTNVGFRSNLEFRPNKKLVIGLTFAANARENENHASPVNPFKYAAFANPYERPYDEDGNYDYDLTYLSNNSTNKTASGLKYEHFNILHEMENTRNTLEGLDANLTARIVYNTKKGLQLTSVFRQAYGYNQGMREIFPGTYASYNGEQFAKPSFPNDLLPFEYDNGSLSENAGKKEEWSWRNQVDYSFTLKKHFFSFLVANELRASKRNTFNYNSPMYDPEYRNIGLPTLPLAEEREDQLKYHEMQGVIGGLFGSGDGQGRTVSFLGQARYSFDDKYVASFSLRYDGADVIGDNNQFTPLWSIGGRWNVEKEKFWDGMRHIINHLSVRGSYGYTGKIDRSAYPFSTLSMSGTRYMDEQIANGFTFPNRSVRWEKKSSFNAGLSFGVLDNALNFSSNYYFNRTTDLLTDLNVPTSTGRGTTRYNGGEVTNEGLEFSATIRWIQRKNFSFSMTGNIAMNRNIIHKSINGITDIQNAADYRTKYGGVINVMGKETGSIYGWDYAGVDATTGNPMVYLSDDGKRAYAEVLDMWETFSDKAQAQAIREGWAPQLDGIPDAVVVERLLYSNSMTSAMELWAPMKKVLNSSMKYLGRSNPKYVGGFSTNIRYKKLALTTYWSYKLGHIVRQFDDRKNAPRTGSGNNADGASSDLQVSNTNREKEFLYRWRNTGDETNIYSFVTGSDVFSNLHTSFDYQKGDYLRLQSISLRYMLPQKTAKWCGFQNMSLTVNANNIVTFTKYKGVDVVTRNAFAYPTPKKCTVRLSLGF